MSDEPDRPEYCAFCHLEKPLTYYDYGEPAWLCRLCERTPAGSMAQFPRQYDGTAQTLMKGMIILAWEVLDAIEAH